jgi:hypothetical protein
VLLRVREQPLHDSAEALKMAPVATIIPSNSPATPSLRTGLSSARSHCGERLGLHCWGRR